MDIMSIIEVPIAWILVTIHNLLEPIFGSGPGPAWPLAIVGLTIVIRILIMPLFFRQIKASRGMQLMQPDLQALQKKYKGKKDPVSRQAQQQEMMALYKKHNANPMASCLPLLAQMPIFIGLFNVLRALPPLAEGTYRKGGEIVASLGPLNAELADAANRSKVFGAPLASAFNTAGQFPGDELTIRIVAVILIIVMAGSQFLSMRQLTMKNMPASAMDNPMFRQQKMMMYFMPLIFVFTGTMFQMGLLVYWTVSNFWAIGQQMYTIRRQPAPGSEAYKAKQARDAAKRAKKGLPPEEDDIAAPEEVQPQGQRVQPMGKNRAKKKGVNPTAPLEAAAEEAEEAVVEVEDSADEDIEDEVRGKDGLTDAERAQRRYEQRAAEHKAARDKRKAAEKRRVEEAKGRYDKDR
ncbi:MAG: membrane protein insertase YidC [bacterium]|nr:membrane protein insertase YidC [bacterium]